jgi:hypothetical protein
MTTDPDIATRLRRDVGVAYGSADFGLESTAAVVVDVPDLRAILDRLARAEAAVEGLRNLVYHASEIMVSHEDATMLYSEWADFAEAIAEARRLLAIPEAQEDPPKSKPMQECSCGHIFANHYDSGRLTPCWAWRCECKAWAPIPEAQEADR